MTYDCRTEEIRSYGKGRCPDIRPFTDDFDRCTAIIMPEKSQQYDKVLVTEQVCTKSMKNDELGDCRGEDCGCCDSDECRKLRYEYIEPPPPLNCRGDCCRISECATCKYDFGPEDIEEEQLESLCDCCQREQCYEDEEDCECGCNCKKVLLNEQYPTQCCGTGYHTEGPGCEYEHWEKEWEDLPGEWF